jgi:putative ABC transport system permease protein
MIEQLRQDLKYAARAFTRAPGFAIVAVLTVAIGVGANAAIFSVVNATLLRPLPFPDARELVLVSHSNKRTRQPGGGAAPANFLDWRIRNHAFAGMSGYREASLILSDTGFPERHRAAIVNANFFDVLKLRPAVGRTFLPQEEGRGAARVAVISDSFWRERFGKRPDIVGQTVRFDDEVYSIVGVMAPAVDFPGRAQVWITPHWAVPDDPLLPSTEDPSSQRGHTYFSVLARMKPGTTIDSAAADMDRVAASLERDFPDDNMDVGAAVERLRDELIVSDVRETTLLLFAAVGLLLLIAAANVSGLLMARATGRQQEISLRAALGATRGRILAQLLTESVLLATIGGGTGVLLAMWLVPALVALSPTDLTVTGAVTIDRTVMAFGLAISTMAGLLFGLAPARQLANVDVQDDLKQTGRGSIGVRQRRARSVLIAGEIALSLVLLVVAGLTVRSFIAVQRAPAGFVTDRVLTFRLAPQASRTLADRADFWERSVKAMAAIPGIEMAGATSRLPLLPGNSSRGLTIRDLPPNSQPEADYRTASPDYFAVMGIPLLRGRGFSDADREDRPLVALVSVVAAQRFWPGRDPVGQHFQIDDPGPEYTVVGLVGDVRSASLEIAPRPTIYVPYRQDAFPSMVVVLKTPLAAAAVANSVRTAMLEVDKDQPVGAILTMDEQLSRSLTRRRFGVTLLSLFGAVAVVLAAIGLYGVLAFLVSQRRREIGVRIALGATARDVMRDVLGEGLRLAGIGMVLGLALAVAASRLMSSLLYATSPVDVATYAGAASLLAVIAVAASFVPAFRASRVDPIVALRDE